MQKDITDLSDFQNQSNKQASKSLGDQDKLLLAKIIGMFFLKWKNPLVAWGQQITSQLRMHVSIIYLLLFTTALIWVIKSLIASRAGPIGA